MELREIVNPLLSWYRENARVLPWRSKITPYRTWISEIMLQQTRVETVIPYYERFLNELPDIAALASVPEDRLLKLWEGLGYYSRARNLQKAAKVIMEKYNGSFPDFYKEVLALPGIGEYTAGAILSIAFEKPFPAVDGNVMRVICRLTGDRSDIMENKTRSAIRDELQQIYPAKDCGDFTQSLMELGATVCLPNGAPLCEKCPLKKQCTAQAEDSIMKIPVKKQQKARRIEQKTVLLLEYGDYIAVRQRPDKGLLAGLWEFPMLEGYANTAEIKKYLNQMGCQVGNLKKADSAKHIFSHLEWHMKGYIVQCSEMPSEFTWVSRSQLKKDFALPTALKAFSK